MGAVHIVQMREEHVLLLAQVHLKVAERLTEQLLHLVEHKVLHQHVADELLYYRPLAAYATMVNLESVVDKQIGWPLTE